MKRTNSIIVAVTIVTAALLAIIAVAALLATTLAKAQAADVCAPGFRPDVLGRCVCPDPSYVIRIDPHTGNSICVRPGGRGAVTFAPDGAPQPIGTPADDGGSGGGGNSGHSDNGNHYGNDRPDANPHDQNNKHNEAE